MRHELSIMLICGASLVWACDQEKAAHPAEAHERQHADESAHVAEAWVNVMGTKEASASPRSRLADATPATSASASAASPASAAAQPVAPPRAMPPSATPTPVAPARTVQPSVAPIVPDIEVLSIDVPTPASVLEGVACNAPVGSAAPLALHRDGAFQFGWRAGGGTVVVGCEGKRRQLHAEPRAQIWTSDPDGNLYFAYAQQLPGTRAGKQVVVAKLDGEGELLWTQAIDTGQTSAAPNVIRADTTGVRVAGGADGQLPGNPPAARGQPWTIGYDREGRLLWFKQLTGDLALGGTNHFSRVFEEADVDQDDELYLLGGSTFGSLALHKLDASGTPQWSVERAAPCGSPHQLRVFEHGDAIYHLGSEGAHRTCVAKLDGEGRSLWTRTLVPHHEVVVDAVEGTKWSGDAIPQSGLLAIGDESLFVLGGYRNQYRLGASPPPTFNSLWVVELGFDGNVRGTHHVRVGPLEVERGETGSRTSYTPKGAAVLSNGGGLQVLGVYQASPSAKQKLVVITLALGQSPAVPSKPAAWLGRVLSRKTEPAVEGRPAPQR